MRLNRFGRFARTLCKIWLTADIAGIALLWLSIDGEFFDFTRFAVWGAVLCAHAALNLCAVRFSK